MIKGKLLCLPKSSRTAQEASYAVVEIVARKMKSYTDVGCPNPSEGWGHGGRPWSLRSRKTPKVWTRGRRETESRQRVSGAKSP